MKKIIKRALTALFLIWLSLLVYPVGYFVLDHKQDVSCFQNDPHKKYEGVGVYLINLDRSKERYHYIIGNLQELGLPVHRVSGVDGKLLTQQELDEKVDFEALKMTYKHSYVGAIGCSLSHMKAWETFLKSDYEFAIVFEDDVSFEPKKLRTAIDELVQNKTLWDVCTFNMYLFKGKQHQALTVKDLRDNEKLLTYLKTTPCAGCYILNRETALKYIERKFPIKMAVDDYYARSWEFGIKFTGVEPCLVHQTYGDSDLASTNNMDKMKSEPFDIALKIRKIMFRVQKHHIAFFYNLKNWLSFKLGLNY